MSQITYLEAIRQALWEEMERDPRVFLMGQDIGEYGGAFKVTVGFLEHFGAERVIDTPIVESGMVGAAAGAALMDRRPVVEMQFIDFIANAFDQLVNFVAKCHWRWGEPMPLVVRGPAGGGARGGPFHSQNPEAFFHHVPGLKIVQPATPYDAKGLLKAAIRDPDPVLYLEHKFLYRRIKEDVPEGDYVVPLGKATVRRPGRDLTIVTYGAIVHRCLEAAEKLAAQGVEAEVVDLRTLLPLDAATVVESVQRTSKAVIVHEDTRTGGIGAEIAAVQSEAAFEHLDGPIRRVAARDCGVPYSPPLEDAFMPQTEDILRACDELAAY
ncbi:MAG: alpha-ketoacid dehydrogenase subunit beta [Candidatus Krumholzibacteriia bacterium]